MKSQKNKPLKIKISSGQYTLYKPNGETTIELPDMKKADGKTYKSDSIGISVKPGEDCFIIVLTEKDYEKWKKQEVNL